MLDKSFLGNEKSLLKKDIKFKKHIEKYNLINKQINKLQENRGYLSYENIILLKKLIKMKFYTKKELIKCKKNTLKVL